MVVIFLALIRCVAEPFRLQHYSLAVLTFEDVKPFIIGALVTSVALLVMTILSFYQKHKFIIVVCILTVIILFVIKGIYLGL